ncbi:MAG TPA: chromate resistance protein ChrB domain-containing protein [Candidatus Eisenbacteria bacterium]|nr:chromate resistance protein ChrB domain-containing protein [Candidatus Eisenbacteria bacterium]
MRFVTRAKVHVDRIATAWAIRRFVDPDASFEFVDRNRDPNELGAIPFDMRGAELGHHGGKCTFEVLLEKYELRDPALRCMGAIIRAIDVPLDDETPPALVELAAAFHRIRDSANSDDERLIQGALICDEMYFGCGGARPKHDNDRFRRRC